MASQPIPAPQGPPLLQGQKQGVTGGVSIGRVQARLTAPTKTGNWHQVKRDPCPGSNWMSQGFNRKAGGLPALSLSTDHLDEA